VKNTSDDPTHRNVSKKEIVLSIFIAFYLIVAVTIYSYYSVLVGLGMIGLLIIFVSVALLFAPKEKRAALIFRDLAHLPTERIIFHMKGIFRLGSFFTFLVGLFFAFLLSSLKQEPLQRNDILAMCGLIIICAAFFLLLGVYRGSGQAN
jgi:hypothetical protein